MPQEPTHPTPDADEPSFEAALSEVEAIIERIEGGQLGLEQQIEAYERGARLLARCRAVLQRSEQRVRRIDEELDAVDPDASAQPGEKHSER